LKNSEAKSERTKRLYFENPYQVEFEARVVERLRIGEKPAVVLDQTCFYPESGGQPSDRGTLNEIKVLGVREEDSKIIHLLENDISAVKVKGKIDWQTRFDFMQQHAGQHILSQCFYELYQAQTLSFHLGEIASTVEIDLRKVSEEEVERVEARANEIVFQNREIKCYFVPEEKVSGVPLRKPPKKEGLIRVVEVADFDYSACGGTHPSKTGEIGLIKVLKWDKIRDNVRFEFVCGQRVLKDYGRKNKNLRELSNILTVSDQEALASVEKLQSDLKSQKREIRKMQERISQYEAQEIIQNTEGQIIKEIFTERAPDEVRSLALNIIKKGDFVVLYALKGEERGHLVFACTESLNLDMRELVPIVSPLVKGKGGGSPSLVQIGAEEIGNLELALDKANEIISIRISGKQ
jgi:alanyl-tRNA synthetase